MNFTEYFQQDPEICGGETVLKGTRVTLRTVLASLAEGSSLEEILRDFPSLSEEHVRAVVAFAAASAKEDLPIQSLPGAVLANFAPLGVSVVLLRAEVATEGRLEP